MKENVKTLPCRIYQIQTFQSPIERQQKYGCSIHHIKEPLSLLREQNETSRQERKLINKIKKREQGTKGK